MKMEPGQTSNPFRLGLVVEGRNVFGWVYARTVQPTKDGYLIDIQCQNGRLRNVPTYMVNVVKDETTLRKLSDLLQLPKEGRFSIHEQLKLCPKPTVDVSAVHEDKSDSDGTIIPIRRQLNSAADKGYTTYSTDRNTDTSRT